ncbi:MAG: ABC-F family ATP-binding cassette domain-containing protein [Myxococcota bacterium]|nr:ABC-F family ATP-binding cassette domain-containing protein [Myxococcota bacterium]
MLLRLEQVSRSFGDRTLFERVEVEVRAGDRIGIVGPNGAGKTTLLRIAAGIDPPDGGRVHLPRGACVGLLRQEIDPRRDETVRSEAATALSHLADLEAEMRDLERQIAEIAGAVPDSLAGRYDVASTRFEHASGFARDARVDAVLEGLGFDAAARERPLSSFSGGWLMRVELAKLLLAEPDVLLLDEPTNHLDLPTIEWFESVLASFRGALLVVSHDRSFLRRHVTRIAELDGRGRFTLYEHRYDDYLAERKQRQLEQRAARARQDREIAHLEQFVDRFRYKASKAKQAQSKLKAIERIELIEVAVDATRGPRLRIPEPARAGRVVLRLESVHKRYGDNVVYSGLDFQLERGERVALVGPNGAGKSTLLRIGAGAIDIDSGVRETGHNVETAYFAQHQLEALDERHSVLEALAAEATLADHARLRSHLGALLFSGDDVSKPISVLSGGEKARVALAKLLLRPSNLLVLDEPTNHLDVTACEILEQALASFAGTLLFVSHDRSFINAIATRVVEVQPGRIQSFPGNYDDYQRKLAASNTTAADPARGAPVATKAERIAARQAERERQKSIERVRRKLSASETEIQATEQALVELAHRLADPEVYRDGERVREIEAERSTLQERTDALYRDWELLAAELESAEQS